MKKKLLLISIFFLTSINLIMAQQGTLDSTFSGDGKLFLAPSASHDNAYGVVVQADSNIVIGGVSITQSATSFDICAVRVHPDGSIDSTFGTNGYTIYDHAGGFDVAYDIDLQTDGKIIMTGAVSITAANTDMLVVRLNTDGSFDSTFAGNGKLIIPINTSEDYAREAAIQPDGKILIGGYTKTPGFTYNNAVMVRINTDGTLDTTFGTGGIALPNFSTQSETIDAITLTPTGDIRAVGYSWANNTAQGIAMGFFANGSVDSTFGTNGMRNMTGMSYARGIVQRNNKYYVCGNGSVAGIITAMTEGGVNISTFGSGGNVVVNLFNSVAYNEITTQQDGKIIAGGGTSIAMFQSDFLITRIDTAGVLDATFGVNGNVHLDLGIQTSESLYGLAIQYDGKILGAGTSIVTTNNDMAIVRLNASSTATAVAEIGVDNNSAIVYPNPATNFFTIAFEQNAGVKNISLINSFGQVVFQKQNQKENTLQIDASSFPKGIY